MDDKKNIITLTDIKEGQTGIIISIMGGKHATKRLADLGLNTGTKIRVLRRAFFSGPVEIEIFGSRLALGRGLASKIIVELK
jgi:Fe2+ transport system protein FeoA